MPSPSPSSLPTSAPTGPTTLTIAPESLDLSATKPSDAVGKAYLVNVNDNVMSGTIELLSHSHASCDLIHYSCRCRTPLCNASKIVPSNFTLSPGRILNIDLRVSSSGLALVRHNLTVGITAKTTNSLPQDFSLPVVVTINAKADKRQTRVTVVGSPTLEQTWGGIWIQPFDSDGFPIIQSDAADFTATLRRFAQTSSEGRRLAGGLGTYEVTCSFSWKDDSIRGDCLLPDTGVAGERNLTVFLRGEAFFSTRVRAKCAKGGFEDLSGECELCPSPGAFCGVGTTLSTLKLLPGYWRTGEMSKDVQECAFGKESCPGQATSIVCDSAISQSNSTHNRSNTNSYCACAYVGPRCSVCAPNHFIGWAGNMCSPCDATSIHMPTLVLCSSILAVCVVAGVVIYGKQDEIAAMPYAIRAQELIKVGQNKVQMLFFLLQVIAAYSNISSGTGDQGIPEPAASFANAFDFTNFDFVQLAPTDCAISDLNFYRYILVQTLFPPALIALLFLWPLGCWALGMPYIHAERTAGYLTLFFLEVITPSVLTAVLQAFACQEFDDGW